MYQLPVPSPNVQAFLPLASIFCLLVFITEPRCLLAVLEHKGTRRGHGIAPAETIPMISTALNDEIRVAIPIWSTAEKTSSYIFIVECLFDHWTLNPRVKWNHFQPSFNRRVSLPLNVHMDLTSITMWLASGLRCKDVHPMRSERRGMST